MDRLCPACWPKLDSIRKRSRWRPWPGPGGVTEVGVESGSRSRPGRSASCKLRAPGRIPSRAPGRSTEKRFGARLPEYRERFSYPWVVRLPGTAPSKAPPPANAPAKVSSRGPWKSTAPVTAGAKAKGPEEELDSQKAWCKTWGPRSHQLGLGPRCGRIPENLGLWSMVKTGVQDCAGHACEAQRETTHMDTSL